MRFDQAWHELFMESDTFRSRWLDAIFLILGGQARHEGDQSLIRKMSGRTSSPGVQSQ
jgi:hypothetical protein